jgi:hypothetical protein
LNADILADEASLSVRERNDESNNVTEKIIVAGLQVTLNVSLYRVADKLSAREAEMARQRGLHRIDPPDGLKKVNLFVQNHSTKSLSKVQSLARWFFESALQDSLVRVHLRRIAEG